MIENVKVGKKYKGIINGETIEIVNMKTNDNGIEYVSYKGKNEKVFETTLSHFVRLLLKEIQ